MDERLDPARLDELWDFSDPSASAARFAAEPASGIAALELQTQRARALGLAGRGAEADALLASLESEHPLVLTRIALEKGRRLNSDGAPAEATPFFAEALRISPDDFLTVDALHMLAIVEPDGDWLARGLRVVDETTDARTKRWAISLHNNAGWAHFDAGRNVEALAEFELAAEAARRHGTEQQRVWAQGGHRRGQGGARRGSAQSRILTGSASLLNTMRHGRHPDVPRAPVARHPG